MANEVLITVAARDYASKTIQGVQQSAERMAGAIRVASIATAAATAAIGTKMVMAASNLTESLNKVNVVFGESASEITDWARTSATNVGLAQQAALEAAGTFGNLFVTMGLGVEPASDMSRGLVELAADLASFNNIGVDEALEKLRAGLVGEVEPLRTVGVALNAAAVEAYALQTGLAATKDEITEADKVTARYALIMQQTATAQGDFARTSDGLANSMRIARAQIEDLAAKIGILLLPVVTAVVAGVVAKLNEFAAWFEQNKPQIEAAFKDISTAVGNMAGAFGEGMGVIMPHLSNFAQFIYENKPLLIASIIAIGAAIAYAFGPASLAVASILGIISVIGYMRERWGIVLDLIQQYIQRFIEHVLERFGFIQPIINGVVKALELFTGAWATAFNAIADGAGRFATYVIERLNQVIDKLGDFIEGVRKVPKLGDLLGFAGIPEGQIFNGGGLGVPSFPKIGKPDFSEFAGLGQFAGDLKNAIFGTGGTGGNEGDDGASRGPLDAFAQAAGAAIPAFNDAAAALAGGGSKGGGGSLKSAAEELADRLEEAARLTENRNLALANKAMREAEEAARALAEQHDRLAEAERKREQELLANAQGAAGFAQRVGATSLSSQAAIASMFGFAPPELNVTVP